MPLALRPSSTSYFSRPETGLDPSLFDGMRLRPAVRQWILGTVTGWLGEHYAAPERWSRTWIAGSGASYQWSASRDPADLDLMLGIDYVAFRQANPDYAGLSDAQVAAELNERMRQSLYPEVDGISFGGGTFQVTVYVNDGVDARPGGIAFIHPYAAYDVSADDWTVPPDPHPVVGNHPSWHLAVEADRDRARRIARAYDDALRSIRAATNPAHRANAEAALRVALDAASGLYQEIHAGRRAAFGPEGAGYADFHNYRWQAGKASGVVQAMKSMHDYQEQRRVAAEMETYGMELPDHESLVRRAGLSYRTA